MARASRATWLSAAFLSVFVVAAAGPVATAAPKKDTKSADAPLKPVPALKEKVSEKVAPFKWGMSSAEVFSLLDKDIDAFYQEKISKAYNPKQQAFWEKEADKKKKEVRSKLFEFKGGAGVSGYEVKAPGEFTYKNSESALDVYRLKGGDTPRQLFFINDRLYKIYQNKELTSKDAELGETWDQAVDKFTAQLGAKGKHVDAKSNSPSYFGVLMQVPEHLLWSDGTTQIRLVNHTKREDMTVRTAAVVYEEIATVEKLPTYRTHVEAKATDAMVDKAGYTAPAPADDSKDKKKKK